MSINEDAELERIREEKKAELLKHREEEARIQATLRKLTQGTVHIGSCSHFTKIFNMLSGRIPVIAYVWADWCGPCKQLGPIFEKISQKYQGKALFLKINSEDCKDFMTQWKVMGIPTILAFQRWQLVDRTTGAVPAWQLEKFVQKAIQFT